MKKLLTTSKTKMLLRKVKERKIISQRKISESVERRLARI
jgi:hypothetical protein